MDLTQFIDGAAILAAKGVICDKCLNVMIDPRTVIAESNGIQCSHQFCLACVKGLNGFCPFHGNEITRIEENIGAIKNMNDLEVKCPRFTLGCKMKDRLWKWTQV